MTEKQIKNLNKSGTFEDLPINGTLEETHISWVIVGKSPKVHAISVEQEVGDEKGFKFHVRELRKYLQLMNRYINVRN